MHKPFFNPPDHIVKEWPEVFNDLYMNTMPVEYLDYIHLEFSNGRVWQINIKDQLKKLSAEMVAERLLETMIEYHNDITNLDFKLNIPKLKKDIYQSSKSLL